MLAKQLELIKEQTSPLFRIMWQYNENEPDRKSFENNICAFHIGGGYVLSVAHNLRIEAGIIKSLNEEIYTNEIANILEPQVRDFLNQAYVADSATKKRYLHVPNNNNIQYITDRLKEINFDTRWITLTKRKICSPKLIVQFKNNLFYNDTELSKHFDSTNSFHEQGIERHTFLLNLELVEAYYSEDIALYKIVNTDKSIIDRIPSLMPDYTILSDNQSSVYCVQSSPNGFLGRLVNKAFIEGYIDHHGIFQDRIGGNYILEGSRYLIKGYFRFGSSGAPYVYYDTESGEYKANAIQSEASPIQLSINNNREGNFQYVNAIASPLQIIENRLKNHLKTDKS